MTTLPTSGEAGTAPLPEAPPPRLSSSGGARWRSVAATVAISILPWIVAVALWELAWAQKWMTTSLFPPPSVFLSYVIENDFRVGFARDAMPIPVAVVASAYRVLAGLALGFVGAIVTGILISLSRTASLIIFPFIRGLAPIAPIAWIPLGIVLFGIGNGTAVFVVFTGIYFILTINTVVAVQAVDKRMIKTARSFGASPRQVWLWVIFPAVLPQVFTMLRLNFFAAWMAVLAAEMVGLKNGLGMIIMLGREMFNPNLILVGLLMVGITGYLVDAFLVFVQRRVLWWQSENVK